MWTYDDAARVAIEKADEIMTGFEAPEPGERLDMQSPTAGDRAILDFGPALVAAFDQSTDMYVFVKDAQRRFVACSVPFAKLLGYRHPRQIVGMRDEELSPEYLAEHYRSHDQHILHHGEPLVNLVELVRNVNGTYDWYLTTKAPVFDADGRPIGIVGHTRGLTKRSVQAAALLSLTPAVELISREYGSAISIEQLAQSVSMSASNFTRAFRDQFGVSPHQYLLRIRIMAVCDLLTTTDLAISEIAEQTGFYDQSHLAKAFKEQRGLTAGEYRRRYRESGDVQRSTRMSLSRMPEEPSS